MGKHFSLDLEAMCICTCSVMSDSLWPYGLYSTMSPCRWNFPDKNAEMGCHFLLQGIFLIQGVNLGLLHCRDSTNSKQIAKNKTTTKENSRVATLLADTQILKKTILAGMKRVIFNILKQLIHQEDMTILYVYAPNNKVPKYMQQKLTNKSILCLVISISLSQ